MRLYLIGGRGRLAQAIAHEYADSEVVSPSRCVYEDWSHVGAADKVSCYFDKRASEGAIVFVASGLLDPKLAPQDLARVNYQLPKNLIDGASKLGIKVVTFGTVMESPLQSRNPYVESKTLLGEYVHAVASATNPAIHLQMHTLYGIRQPSEFMFLGQLLASLRQNAPFRMTSGQQFREYHHAADDARAIRQIAAAGCSGVMSISHGKPLSLKSLAEGVFQAFGKNELLHVGALPEPQEENYKKTFTPAKILQSVDFRDSLPAIIQYMKECCPATKLEALGIDT